jgi:hypothetical protein
MSPCILRGGAPDLPRPTTGMEAVVNIDAGRLPPRIYRARNVLCRGVGFLGAFGRPRRPNCLGTERKPRLTTVKLLAASVGTDTCLAAP